MRNQNDDPVTMVMEAFTEFKEANDRQLAAKADGRAFGDLAAKVEKLNALFDKFEPLNQRLTLGSQQQAAMQEQLDRVETIMNRPSGIGDMSSLGGIGRGSKMMDAFDRILRKQDRDPSDMELVRHMNSLVKGNDAGAGYLLAPPDMQKDIIKNIVEVTPMRAICAVKMIGSQSYKRPKRIGTLSATRVGEIGQRNNTGDPAYGMLEILAPEMFARIEISQQMLEDADYDLLAELRTDSAEQFAYKEGYESINGTGSGTNQCEGILTNPDIGEVVSGSAAAITADGMIDLFHGVKTAYTRNGLFGLNRASLKAVRKLKDTTGQYLWVPGVANAAPNTILGAPYVEMPDLPDPAANVYPVLYGDFMKGYAIVDRIGISFQVDYTTGADNGVVVFRARKRTGGGVLQAEAIKKLKCSA
jgi:HK97 family phage major capsid protein